MTPGKVRSPAALGFPVTDGSILIYAPHMSVECPFGSDMDVKTVPFGNFKEHFSENHLAFQKFPFVLVKKQLVLFFPLFPFFLLFLFQFQTFLFLSFCIRFTCLL